MSDSAASEPKSGTDDAAIVPVTPETDYTTADYVSIVDQTVDIANESDSDDDANVDAHKVHVVATTVTPEAVGRAAQRNGIIQTSFPEQPDDDHRFDDIGPFAESYRTLNAQERLLLLFAENFRQQYSQRCPTRRPLVLAPANECGVQKFVSTSIRPSYVLHTRLLGNWTEMAAFVADYVHYEPLVDQLNLVSVNMFFPLKILKRQCTIVGLLWNVFFYLFRVHHVSYIYRKYL